MFELHDCIYCDGGTLPSGKQCPVCDGTGFTKDNDWLNDPREGWGPDVETEIALTYPSDIGPTASPSAREDRCARCGEPRSEHSYNGACYGKCGKFVAPSACVSPYSELEERLRTLATLLTFAETGSEAGFDKTCWEAADALSQCRAELEGLKAGNAILMGNTNAAIEDYNDARAELEACRGELEARTKTRNLVLDVSHAWSALNAAISPEAERKQPKEG